MTEHGWHVVAEEVRAPFPPWDKEFLPAAHGCVKWLMIAPALTQRHGPQGGP
jgi:hypothetical protein